MKFGTDIHGSKMSPTDFEDHLTMRLIFVLCQTVSLTLGWIAIKCSIYVFMPLECLLQCSLGEIVYSLSGS